MDINVKLLGFFSKDIELPPPLWENNPPGFLVMAHPCEAYPAVPLKGDGGFAVDAYVLSQDEFLSEFTPSGKALHAVWAKALAELQRALADNEPLRGNAQCADLLEAVRRLCRTARDLPGPGAKRPEEDIAREAIASANFTGAPAAFNHILVEAAIGHRRAGNLHQAIFYYRKALKSDPENPNIMFNLSRVYHELGGNTEAKTLLEQILSLKPDMHVARQYLEFLGK